ncbi:MAG: hypothetical protein WKG06_47865 [Segetibacter sp.]
MSAGIIEDDVISRLMSFSNVLITAHQGFFTREALTKIAVVTLSNINSVFKKEDFKNNNGILI